MKKTELLIPVGNYECLLAAINNGADAIYLGGKKFGARAYSDNFTEEELINAINTCHLNNVKIYVTVNTMIFNEEIQDVLNYLKFLYKNHVDAVIMQDNGIIELTRKLIPNLEIHVSTQAHNHNESQIQHYKDIGCTRVVFDRESSLETIKNIKTNIEKEVFVYGALCICYSGNCLFSALNGSRSANRGMCVGSCRLPYKLSKNNIIEKEGFILSTKDLNTLPKIKQILDSNIDSLKVEGRMKSKEYVAQVTKTFRKLIDQYYENKEPILTKEDNKNLLKTYNRDFTLGYLFNEDHIINEKTSNHQGIPIGTIIDVNNKKITIQLTEDLNQEDAIRFEATNQGMYLNTLYDKKGLLTNHVPSNNICQIDNKFRTMFKDLINTKVLKTIDIKLNKELNSKENKRNPIFMHFKANLGTNTILTIKYQDITIKTEGRPVERSINAPTTKDTILKQLSKLGNTPFIANKIDIEIDDNIFINIKELNELRRISIENLINSINQEPIKDFKLEIKELPKQNSNNPKISISVNNEEQLNIALRNNIDYIYISDENLYNKYKENQNIYLKLDRVIEKHKEYNNERLLCTEFGSILKYKENNNIRSDYYLNVANDYTINKFKNLNIKSITLSVELETEQLNKIKNKQLSEIIVYGKPECMIIKNNIFNITNEKTYIIDTKNNKYPVTTKNNFTHIYNHKNINLLDKLDRLKGFGTYRIELLDENIIETQSIINKLKNSL